MKKVILLLCLAALLTGCGSRTAGSEPSQAPETVTSASAETAEAAAPDQAVDSEQTSVSEASLLPELTESSMPLSYDAYRIVYNVFTEDNQEFGTFQGIDADGALVWTYETDRFSAAQLPRITPIGQFEGTYYLIEDGTVVALDVCTGRVLFENPDFQGSPADDSAIIDDYGYLYLSGYDGPDFFAMDPQGNTVKRISFLSDEYMRPFRLRLEEDQIVVYMESDSHGNSGSFPCYVEMDWLPQAMG